MVMSALDPTGFGDGGPKRLPAALDSAKDARAACQAAVDHLVACGFTMPSLYLYRGGRLRCYAVRGYWQVFDGMPPSAGVIGRCFRTGAVVVVDRVQKSVDYLEAIPGVRSEVCVPLRIDDEVVGALNIESLTRVSSGTVDTLQQVAGLLGARLGRLGGVPAESSYQRLATYAQKFAGADSEQELQQLAVEAARNLSALDSAVLALHADDELAVGVADGSLASSLSDIDERGLRLFESWVVAGTSCYSVNDESGRAFAGHEQVRKAGAQTVVVVPLVASGEDLGLLIVADPSAVLPEPAVVELLEVLGSLTATSLLTIRALEQLRQQAACDPLTGLGHAGAFQDALAEALHTAAPGEVAVAVTDIDRFKNVNDLHGHQAGDELLQSFATQLADVLVENDRLYRIGGDEFAAILHVKSAADAVTAAQLLVQRARDVDNGSVSVGVAVGAPEESPSDIVRRADQALYRAKRAGRNTYRLSAKSRLDPISLDRRPTDPAPPGPTPGAAPKSVRGGES